MHEPVAAQLIENLKSDALLEKRNAGRRRFSPNLSYGRHVGPSLPSTKQAAVLIMLERCGGLWTIPLTVRPMHLPDHPGQISFPGGRVETGESHLEAAKREFREELGAEFEGTVLGELRPIFVYNSNYFVRSFVAIHEQSFEYTPCDYEVERIVKLPVSSLNDASCHSQSSFHRGSMTWRARVFNHESDQVWGATAILLGELAAVVKDVDFR